MSEPEKVRLVRCPKCENLLPELTNYSVYQCGGCGTVLRAKNRNIEADTISQKSDEERGLGVSEKISSKSENFNFIKKGNMSSRDVLENDVKSRGSSSSRVENREISSESAENYRNASKIKADKWVLENDLEMNENLDEFEELEPQNRSRRARPSSDSNSSKIKADKWVVDNDLDEVNENLDEFGHLQEGKQFGELKPQIESVIGSRRPKESSDWNASKIRADKWVLEEDLEVKLNLNEFGHFKNGKEFEELRPQNEHLIESRRTRQISDRRIEEQSEMERFQRNPRDSKYLEEGPSNYQPSYGYGEPMKNRVEPDRFNKVDYDEKDREELLRKIDELKDQLSHSRDVKDKPKGKIPVVDRRMAYADPYDGSMGSNTASMQYPIPDRYVSRPPPYMNNYMDPSPFMSRNEMAMHNFYPNQGIMDPVRSQMLGRAPHQAPGPFQQHQSHPYFSGQYVDTDIDSFETYPHNINLHPPSCSCFHCYSKHRQVPIPPPPTAFSNKRLPDYPNNPMYYSHENPGSFGPPDYNPRISNPPQLNPHNPQSHARWPSDLSSEVGGFVRRRPPPRVLVATSGRRCRPIAGAAPFFSCHNCFELLQIPKKVLITEKKNQKKVQCGSCSSITLLAVVNKKLVISTHEEKKRISTKVDDIGTPNVVVNRVGMSFSSDDYGDPNYDFQSMDKDLTSSSNKQTEMRSVQSTTPSSSEDEESPDSLINSIEPPVKANLSSSPPPAGSPLQDHFDYSTKYRAVKRSDKGNQSGRSDQEKMMPQKVTSRQNSMKEASMATELELSSNDYSHTGVSQDSGEASREEDQLRANKGAESFFAGIIKKSFRDFSRSNQLENSKANVTVNGHSIPDRLVKKAEKLAGSIHPGEYWYDFRAGFWGVMGGPCLGIIPPFIEEFNYPIPENCSCGNSGVFVNGRELHQKDLDLLGSRGLPTARDRAYIIEISGRVLDEDSGEELDSLGKLAPTVERVKHGFGMKTPRTAAT